MMNFNYLFKYACYVPDFLLKRVIDRELSTRLLSEASKETIDFVSHLKNRYETIAIEQDKANEQHYTVPTSFYQYVLG